MAGKITKREASAWGDTIHRTTKAGNKTQTFNNFWGEQETTWVTKDSKGRTIEHNQTRYKGKLVNSSTRVLEDKKKSNQAYHRVEQDVIESFDIFSLFMVLKIMLIIVLLACTICILPFALYIVAAIFTYRTFSPFLYNYLFVGIFNHNLFKSHRLALKLRRNLLRLRTLENKYVEKFEIDDLDAFCNLFNKCDKIASALEKRLTKKRAVGMQELLIYGYKRELFRYMPKRYIYNIMQTEMINYFDSAFTLEELREILGKKHENLNLVFPYADIYNKYIEKNEWYTKQEEKNKGFIKKVKNDKKLNIVRTNLAMFYVLRILFSSSFVVVSIIITLGVGDIELVYSHVIITDVLLLVMLAAVFITKLMFRFKYGIKKISIWKILYCKDYRRRNVYSMSIVGKIRNFRYIKSLYTTDCLKVKNTFYISDVDGCTLVIEDERLSAIMFTKIPFILKN